ncbi:hypothetical protein SAMN06295909_3204 [Plantibacter sp. VKM Ac-1784]|uniref:Uncharacterized protein n=1 Tax=Plantibacter elymi (nom. nud.) TaxID=199708 RepID=A0ABY1RHE5_9MICO|nr:hypothetical protein [Plantibacter sp. VKM Ac-1784]SMQ73226.1 hypothetical protein SAMN06295909_3204 [Plantibacter sp. VKM Ac-1784]
MKSVRSFRNMLVGVAMLGLSLGGASSSALASDVQDDGTSAVSSPMEAIKLTADNAVAYGYAVRTDSDGQQWAMDAGTPDGDFTHAVPIAEESGASTRDRVVGNCGSSWVYLSGKEGYRSVYTGYDIQAKFGLPVSHVWSVAVYSSIDFESFDFSGLPSWGAERWFETRFIDTQVIEGLPISTIAGGSVLTTGGLCVSGSPTDTITG